MLSIIAGILIALGGTAFLQTKELIGAILFSIGLLTILHYKCALFTGKAGLLADRAIKPLELLKIYCGNLIGSISMAGLLAITPFGEKLGEQAAAINQIRLTNLWYENIVLGLLCGMFMFIAVAHYETKPWVTMMCVVGFILTGVNHCVADMFYLFLGGFSWKGALALLCTSVGNLIGCNFIPLLLRLHQWFQLRNNQSMIQSHRDNVH